MPLYFGPGIFTKMMDQSKYYFASSRSIIVKENFHSEATLYRFKVIIKDYSIMNTRLLLFLLLPCLITVPMLFRI